MKRLASAFVFVGLGAAPAFAQETPAWTASISIDASRTDGQDGGDDQTSRSGVFSLSRQFDAFELGGSMGASSDDANLPEAITALSATSFNGALWWGTTLNGVDVRLSGSIGRQDLDASLVSAAQTGAKSRLPASFRTATVSLGGERKTQGVALEVSHTFGEGNSVTPFASIGVDRTTTEVNAAVASAGSTLVSDSEEGVTGALGVSFAHDIGERATLSFSAAANATDNAAARTLSRTGGGLTQRGQGEDGGEQWAEFGAGLNLRATPSVSVGLNISGTAGREENDLVGGVSLSKSF